MLEVPLTGMAMMPPPIMKLAMPAFPTPTLIKQLAIRLSPQAGKSLVIPPEGEGANESLCEFHVKP